jgi:hypothetical protein
MMVEQSTWAESASLFVPSSAGNPDDVSALTARAISQSFPFLSELVRQYRPGAVRTMNVLEFCTLADFDRANQFKALCDQYGSDKALSHNYQYLYGPILKDRERVTAVLEIGLGTNNADVVSNMGQHGRPGASLRAFRDFLPNALIFGADVDRRILFQEERIKTYFVDQTDLASFAELEGATAQEFDLIIDDGLHAPNANIAVLIFGLKKLKVGGWLVVEDIPARAAAVWHVVSALLPETYQTQLIQTAMALVFAVKRLR